MKWRIFASPDAMGRERKSNQRVGELVRISACGPFSHTGQHGPPRAACGRLSTGSPPTTQPRLLELGEHRLLDLVQAQGPARKPVLRPLERAGNLPDASGRVLGRASGSSSGPRPALLPGAGQSGLGRRACTRRLDRRDARGTGDRGAVGVHAGDARRRLTSVQCGSRTIRSR